MKKRKKGQNCIRAQPLPMCGGKAFLRNLGRSPTASPPAIRSPGRCEHTPEPLLEACASWHAYCLSPAAHSSNGLQQVPELGRADHRPPPSFDAPRCHPPHPGPPPRGPVTRPAMPGSPPGGHRTSSVTRACCHCRLRLRRGRARRHPVRGSGRRRPVHRRTAAGCLRLHSTCSASSKTRVANWLNAWSKGVEKGRGRCDTTCSAIEERSDQCSERFLSSCRMDTEKTEGGCCEFGFCTDMTRNQTRCEKEHSARRLAVCTATSRSWALLGCNCITHSNQDGPPRPFSLPRMPLESENMIADEAAATQRVRFGHDSASTRTATVEKLLGQPPPENILCSQHWTADQSTA
eukprot:2979952-Rhodomonas_salina.1